MPSERLQEGDSTLIIGRGRVGKSGYTFDLVEEEEKSDNVIILAPRRTILAKMGTGQEGDPGLDFIDWPIKSADDLADAWNEHAKEDDGPLLVLIQRHEKGQPSIWEILQDERFNRFTIHAEELAVLTSRKEDWDAFDIYIRTVGQRNQFFYANTHRVRADIDPAWVQNFQRIIYVGPLADDQELASLYGVSNISTKMTREEFYAKLAGQPEKYDWWSKQPNKEAAFIIFS